MAVKTKFRRDTAANWSAANPVLHAGEPALVTDTQRMKLGDGTTAFNSLAFVSTTANTQTGITRGYGDGSDGDVNLSSGTTTLVRDMYYNNLTITGSGVLVTTGFRVFVKNILNIAGAGVGAINANGGNGGDASGATGGIAAVAIAAMALGGNGGATAGANGSTGAGAAGVAGSSLTGNGGASGSSGAGGAGTNAAGAGKTAVTPTALEMRRYETNFLRGITLIGGGSSGPGGGSGGGDGSNNGGGGGGGGGGGNLLALYARVIVRSRNCPVGTIQSNGGTGGAGADGTGGTLSCGGGGGGAGGGGGWVYICYDKLAGSRGIGLIRADGGNGGVGGAGSLTGGGGGGGGAAGRITIYRTQLDQAIEVIGAPATAGYLAVVTSGGSGAVAPILTYDL